MIMVKRIHGVRLGVLKHVWFQFQFQYWDGVVSQLLFFACLLNVLYV